MSDSILRSGEETLAETIGAKLMFVLFDRGEARLDLRRALPNTNVLGWSLYIYNHFGVTEPGRKIGPGEFGARDALCARIGRRIAGARTILGEALILTFDDGAFVAVSLREGDFRGPRHVAAELYAPNHELAVWGPDGVDKGIYSTGQKAVED